MAYGSPERLADVPAYYADIRGGRPISPEHLEDLVEPLPRARDRGLVAAQRDHRGDARAALEDELGLPVYTGMKHWTPHIADAAEAASLAAPTASSASYSRRTTRRSRSRATGDQLGQALDGRAALAFVESWHDDPGFVALLADRIRGTTAHVVFTAHSLPARIIDMGDPYKDQLLETSAARRPSRRRRGLVVLLPERIADRRAVARARHPRPPRRRCTRPASTTSWSAPSGSYPIIWRSAGTSTPKRRRRRAELGMDSTGSRCRTPTPRSSRSSPTIVTRRARAAPAMTAAGRIVVDRVSARFRVYPERASRTIKDIVVSRGRQRPAAKSWLCTTSRSTVEPGERGRARRRNGSGKTTLLRLVSGIFKPTSGRIAVGGRDRLAARAGRRLPSGLHGARERLPERLDPRPAARADPRADGRDRRVRGARTSSSTCRCARIPRACTCGSDSRSPRTSRPTSCCSTRCSRSATRQFQRKCFGKIDEFKNRGGTIVFVSHDAQAVERLCERAVLLRQGRSSSTVTRARRSPTTGGCSPASATPTSSRPVSRSGAGKSPVSSASTARRRGRGAQPAARGRAGHDRARRRRRPGRCAAAPGWELRDDGGTLVTAGGVATGELGWVTAARSHAAPLPVDRPPLADGRLHLRLELADEHGRLLHHSSTTLCVFVVFPADDGARSRAPRRASCRKSPAAELERI